MEKNKRGKALCIGEEKRCRFSKLPMWDKIKELWVYNYKRQMDPTRNMNNGHYNSPSLIRNSPSNSSHEPTVWYHPEKAPNNQSLFEYRSLTTPVGSVLNYCWCYDSSLPAFSNNPSVHGRCNSPNSCSRYKAEIPMFV